MQMDISFGHGRGYAYDKINIIIIKRKGAPLRLIIIIFLKPF